MGRVETNNAGKDNYDRNPPKQVDENASKREISLCAKQDANHLENGRSAKRDRGLHHCLAFRSTVTPCKCGYHVMSKSIIVEVSPEGELRIEAVGFRGNACEKATAALEKAMGIAGKKSHKPEYRQQESAHQKAGAC